MVGPAAQKLPALAAALAAVLLFAVSIGGTYVFDDLAIIQTDPRIQHPNQWKKYWTDSYNGGVDNLYRPLVSMSYAIEWQLHGDRPWIFHLVNILLHAATSALVAEFARRLLGNGPGLIAGLLYAAHPIHVEAVANIVGRAEIMCALGMFAALVLILKPMTYPRAVAICGCFVLALLSKEQGMLLPLLLLILAKMKKIASPKSRGANLLLAMLLCWLLAGYIVWRESILKFYWDRSFLDWTINPMISTTLPPHVGSIGWDRILMPLVLLGRYTGLLLFPIKLSIDYGGTIIGWHVRPSDPYLYLGIAAILAWFGLIIYSWKKRPIACGFSAIALALTYGMVGNIITLIGTNFGERLMYIPSAFFIIMIVAFLANMPKRAAMAFTIIVMILASVRTVTYAAEWNDRLNFYLISLQRQPKSIRLYLLVTAEYYNRGELDEAATYAARGRELLPDYTEIWNYSGMVAMQQGKFDLAQEYFDHAMKMYPNMKTIGWLQKLGERRAATRPSS